jgi:tetratricopeptide (TPR) repeat protein
MKAFVFTDEALRAEAGRFVWLAIDTEKERNAPVQEKHPIDAWPTLLVVDPHTERVAMRWVGGANVAQLRKILDDGRLAVTPAPAAARGARTATDADSAFTRAEERYAARDFSAAAKAYQEALRLAAPGWPRYSRTVESLLFALYKADDCATSIEVARGALPRLRETPSVMSIAGTGLTCALRAPATDPARAETITLFETAARQAVANSSLAAAADDRSGLYAVLLDARKDAKDASGAHEVAAEWARFLEAEAARATTPEARAVFDSHRLSVYLEMGEPERAIPMLLAAERDFPKDYNPPARLAVAYKEMKRWDEALAAADRALALAYGPRRLRILGTRAEILLARGDRAGARATLQQALAAAETMPPGQRSDRMIAAVRKRLQALN